MPDVATDILQRIELLEKQFQFHLGPARAATSLNIPHQDVASGTDLATLTARVDLLEADMLTAQTDITDLQTQVAALTTYTYTSGRYM